MELRHFYICNICLPTASFPFLQTLHTYHNPLADSCVWGSFNLHRLPSKIFQYTINILATQIQSGIWSCLMLLQLRVCLVLVLWVSSYCQCQLDNHLAEEERADCFTFTTSLLPYGCLYSMSLPQVCHAVIYGLWLWQFLHDYTYLKHIAQV